MKKKLLLLILCLLTFTLAGCAGVELDLFVYSVSDVRYRQLDVKLPTSLYAELNAAEDKKLENYLTRAVSEAGGYFEYQITSADTSNGGYTFLTFVQTLGEGKTSDDNLFASLKEVESSNLFFAKRKVSLTNPFELNGENAFVGKIVDILLNGGKDIKPLTEEFPIVADSDISKLKTCLLLEKRGIDAGNNAKEIVTVDGRKFYLYEGTYGENINPEYAYKVPVSVGWFIVALAAGLVTAAVLLIVLRRRREPGKEIEERKRGYMPPYVPPPPPPEVFNEYPDGKKDDVFTDFPDKKDDDVFGDFPSGENDKK